MSILLYVEKEPYESLHKASMLYLTIKTVLLLYMATTKQVSEINSLAMDSEHLRFNKADASDSLRTQMGFSTKINYPPNAKLA